MGFNNAVRDFLEAEFTSPSEYRILGPCARSRTAGKHRRPRFDERHPAMCIAQLLFHNQQTSAIRSAAVAVLAFYWTPVHSARHASLTLYCPSAFILLFRAAFIAKGKIMARRPPSRADFRDIKRLFLVGSQESILWKLGHIWQYAADF